MMGSRLFACLAFVGAAAVAGAAQQQAKPEAARPTASRTSAGGGNAEHGRYIVEHVAMCVECHSPRDDMGEIRADSRYMGAPIPFRDDAAILNGGSTTVLIAEPALYDQCGILLGGFIIAFRLHHVRRDIGTKLFVN